MTEPVARPQRAVRLCYLGKDPGIPEELAPLLAQQGLQLECFSSELDLITSRTDLGPCAVLVVDLHAGSTEGALVEFVDRLKLRFGSSPKLVCIAQASDIGVRLQALRAGVKAVFPVPVVAAELADKLAELAGIGSPERYRVLIVDDEPVPALFAARVLEKAGMDTMTVGDPLQVLDALGVFRPDLLLMDLYMPKASGAELTTLIRENDAFFDTPIIFVSGEKDAEKQVVALSVGGDEFLSKPVDPTRLVRIVRHRIRSARNTRSKLGSATVRDDVTGLFNRRHCLRRLDRWITEEGGHGPGEGVLFIELDGGARVQAEMGITAIDPMARQVAQVLREQTGSDDVVARFGDHSFVLIVKRPDRETLLSLAEQLRATVSVDPVDLNGRRAPLTVSIGVGLFDPPADDALTMISRAEKACATASAAGGDRVETWVSAVPVTTGAHRDNRLVTLIGQSLRSKGFELFYQPMLALRRRHAERYETFLRLRAPDGEYIPPFDFIPVAQRHGMIAQIDRWVMIRALEVLADRRREHRIPMLFVHQTMASAEDADWVLWLRDQIRDRDLIKARPILQFHLRDVVDHLDLAQSRFEQLRRLYLTICVTHFEDDPAAFEAVERLRIPMVKLSFDMVSGADIGPLTHAIGRLHGMDSTVIAGGIEDAQTVGRVWSCGADLIQGNFIQPPVEDLSFDFGV
ncbi:MAG: EAL domain-containing protein [Chromatiaceae bacterium]